MAKKPNISPDTQRLLMYALVVGGGYYFIVRPALIKFGVLPDPNAVAQQAAQQQNISDYIQNAISRQTPTKSRGEWQIIADTIYTDLTQTVINNRSDAVYQLARPQNDADVAMLIDTFGLRKENWFGFSAGADQGLAQFVTTNLTNSDIATINDNYNRKGIQFQF